VPAALCLPVRAGLEALQRPCLQPAPCACARHAEPAALCLQAHVSLNALKRLYNATQSQLFSMQSRSEEERQGAEVGGQGGCGGWGGRPGPALGCCAFAAHIQP
jgi:hypothetical protein